jgi:diaminopimelate epimerase
MMKLSIPFSKYSGSGNDFIFIDNREGHLPITPNRMFSKLCHRKNGIGADGVVLVEPSATADFKMRIFNADGGEAEMCGNGARCLYKFLHEIGQPKIQYHIETLKSNIHLRAEDEAVCVSMPDPCDLRDPIILADDLGPMPFYYINTGVPHVVCFVNDLQDPKWMAMAPKIRYHKHFQPNGVNVNFVEVDTAQQLHIRTYERGVEEETLSCGTGATAVGLIMADLHNILPPITLIPKSKEKLKINFKKTHDGFRQVELNGSASFIFKGIINLNQDVECVESKQKKWEYII